MKPIPEAEEVLKYFRDQESQTTSEALCCLIVEILSKHNRYDMPLHILDTKILDSTWQDNWEILGGCPADFDDEDIKFKSAVEEIRDGKRTKNMHVFNLDSIPIELRSNTDEFITIGCIIKKLKKMVEGDTFVLERICRELLNGTTPGWFLVQTGGFSEGSMEDNYLSEWPHIAILVDMDDELIESFCKDGLTIVELMVMIKNTPEERAKYCRQLIAASCVSKQHIYDIKLYEEVRIQLYGLLFYGNNFKDRKLEVGKYFDGDNIVCLSQLAYEMYSSEDDFMPEWAADYIKWDGKYHDNCEDKVPMA